MKVKFITLMLLTVTFISYSQTEDFVCGVRYIDENNQVDISQFSNSTDPNVLYCKSTINCIASLYIINGV